MLLQRSGCINFCQVNVSYAFPINKFVTFSSHILPDNIDLRLVNFHQKSLCPSYVFIKHSALAHGFTKIMKFLCIHLCKWSDDLVVINHLA